MEKIEKTVEVIDHEVSNQFEILLSHISHLRHYYKMTYLNSYKQKTFSDIVENVKCRLNKFAHSNTKKELNEAINDLRSWKLYQEKVTTWVEGNKKPCNI